MAQVLQVIYHYRRNSKLSPPRLAISRSSASTASAALALDVGRTSTAIAYSRWHPPASRVAPQALLARVRGPRAQHSAPRHRAVPYVELERFQCAKEEVFGAQGRIVRVGKGQTEALERSDERREARGPLNAQLHGCLHNHVARHAKCGKPTERRHRALLPVAIQVELVDVIGICQGPYIQEPDVLERRKVL